MLNDARIPHPKTPLELARYWSNTFRISVALARSFGTPMKSTSIAASNSAKYFTQWKHEMNQ